MAPELVLGAWFVLLVVLDLLLPGRASRRSWIGGLTLAGVLGAGVLVLLRMIDMNGSEPAEVISLLGDSYRIDDFGSLLKLFVLAGTAVVVLLGLGTAERDSAITDKGEYFYLLLPAAMAGHPALAPGFTRLFAGPLVRRALLVGSFATLARDVSLLVSIHRRKSAILCCHRDLLTT